MNVNQFKELIGKLKVMLMKKTFLIIIAFLITFVSCNPSKETRIENEISRLLKKHPQLPRGSHKQTDFYRVVRSVTFDDDKIQVQLRSSPDSIYDPQQIIVFIYKDNKCFAIPFFSNTYRDYWNFQFDSPDPNIEKINTTFEKEIKNALGFIKESENEVSDQYVMDEIMLSLLNCVVVNEGDSSNVNRLIIKDNNKMLIEDISLAKIRVNKNFKAFSSEWHLNNIENYNSFWDLKNNRVYQIIYREESQFKKLIFTIKSYRQDCVYHYELLKI